jgi:hypothetical protein
MNSTVLDKSVGLFIVIMRYPMSVIDHKDGSSRANLQVWKGGLPPLERRRRDWLLQLSSYSPTAQALACFHSEYSFASY